MRGEIKAQKKQLICFIRNLLCTGNAAQFLVRHFITANVINIVRRRRLFLIITYCTNNFYFIRDRFVKMCFGIFKNQFQFVINTRGTGSAIAIIRNWIKIKKQ